MKMNSVLGTEFGADPGRPHTKGYGMSHLRDVPNIILSPEVPLLLRVHVLAVD